MSATDLLSTLGHTVSFTRTTEACLSRSCHPATHIDPVRSLLHPRITRRVGVHRRATMINSRRTQFIVPRFIAVDLAQPVRGAVFGQPHSCSGGADVDGVSGHVSRRLGRCDPSLGRSFRAVLLDRLLQQLVLIFGGTPAAVDQDLDAVVRRIGCGPAKRGEELRVEVGHGRIIGVEDSHAIRDNAVRLAGCALVVRAVMTVRAGIRGGGDT